MDANKLAILAGQVGGTSYLADILNVDETLLDKAVRGEHLKRYQSEDIDAAIRLLSDGGESSDLAIMHGLDIPAINDLADSLDTASMIMQDDQAFNKYRRIVAAGGVSDYDIENSWALFGNLPPQQTQNVLDAALDFEERNKEKFIRALDNTRIAAHKKVLLAIKVSEMDSFTAMDARRMLQELPLDRGRRKGKALLTDWQSRRLLTNLTNSPDLTEMFAAFNADDGDIWNIETSQFWAWFREMFYA